MKQLVIIGVCLIFFVACNSAQREYQNRLEEEMASGDRYDSLFLKLHLGMSKKDFYAVCWKLNKEGKLTQGPSNLSAEYDLENGELKFPAQMRFYPQFNNDLIYSMPVEFSYEAFMPTDPRLSSDSLLTDVKQLLESWYGDDFIYLEDEEGRKVYVKVDGNRRIRLFKKNLSTVAMDITDMPVYFELNDQNEAE